MPAPIWPFLSALGATEDPEASKTATDGLHLVETYPAAALPTLATKSFGRMLALKYNPKPRSKFKPDDWVVVATAAAAEAQSLGCDDVAVWCASAAGIPHPMKDDHDKLDAVICLLVAIRWRLRPRTDSVMLGDLGTGYMVIPASADVRAYLMKVARPEGVPMDGLVPVWVRRLLFEAREPPQVSDLPTDVNPFAEIIPDRCNGECNSSVTDPWPGPHPRQPLAPAECQRKGGRCRMVSTACSGCAGLVQRGARLQCRS